MTQVVSARRGAPVTPSHGELEPLGVGAVSLDGGFWGERQTLDAAAIVPHALDWVERLGWVGNLRNAALGRRYEHRGREFADSEIYKLIEAMSWLSATGTADFSDELDNLVNVVVAAQSPDGYLHTLFGRPWQRPRYSDFTWGHELYCFGHLMQAAVAHHRATGSERLLDVAVRLADHVVVMFGPSGLNQVCGHAEVELGLAELARETGRPEYLAQAALFVDRRGTGTLPLFEFGRAYWQDDVPVRHSPVLRGHAVRALYLAAGATDVAVDLDDDDLLEALRAQWENTVRRRTYITGGMGSHHMDEAFGDDFVLPPDRSYCETCAGVASIMFSWRLLLATGEVKYADLIERTLFNVVATSPSATGTSFFYANTLHQRVEHAPPALNDDGVVIRGGSAGRQAWYEVSCCPPNVARMLGSLGAYVASAGPLGPVVHQYAAGRIASDGWILEVATAYPSAGTVTLRVVEAPAAGGTITLRVPAWAAGATVASADGRRSVPAGWAEVSATTGDEVELDLPLVPRRSIPDERVDAVRGTLAFERGPEVWALESVDLPPGWSLEEIRVTEAAPRYVDGRVVVEVVRATESDAPWPFGSRAPLSTSNPVFVPLVRYHEWAERGPSTMRIWIPTIPTRTAR